MSVELGKLEDVDLRNTSWLFIATSYVPLSSLELRFSSDANRHVTDHGFLENVGVKFRKARNQLTIHLFSS